MNTIARLGLGLRPTVALSHIVGANISRRYTATLQPRIHMHISGSRAEGLDYVTQLRTRTDGLYVYTDASRARKPSGGVGAAARSTIPACGTVVLTQYLGSAKEYSSVEAEMHGIILGVKVAQMFPALTQLTILSDCQPAIRELFRGKSKYEPLTERFHAEVRRMENLRLIRLVWVPGHERVDMNELVDADAKAAAAGETRLTISGPQFINFVQI